MGQVTSSMNNSEMIITISIFFFLEKKIFTDPFWSVPFFSFFAHFFPPLVLFVWALFLVGIISRHDSRERKIYIDIGTPMNYAKTSSTLKRQSWIEGGEKTYTVSRPCSISVLDTQKTNVLKNTDIFDVFIYLFFVVFQWLFDDSFHVEIMIFTSQ